VDEEVTGSINLLWMVLAILAFGAVSLLTFIVIFIFKLLKKLFIFLGSFMREKQELEDFAYIEQVEKITRAKKREVLGRRRVRYSSLKTENERIRFIYREYVRRAKGKGFTGDPPSGTPDEILDGIDQTAEPPFPHPGRLGGAYNMARYGTFETSGADELKKILL